MGVEIDPHLVEHARASADTLCASNARFVQGDLREIELPSADVYFMFVPASGSTEWAARLEPIAARRPIRLFSQALDLRCLPWLRRAGAGSHWVESYTSGQ